MAEQLKILILTTEFIPVQGGISTYVLELSKNLSEKHEVMVVTPDIYDNSCTTINFDLKNIIINPIGKSLGGFIDGLNYRLSCRRVLPDILKKFKPDIIHSQSTMPDMFIDPKKINIPILTTIHSTIRGQNQVLGASGLKKSAFSHNERVVAAMGPLIERIEEKYYSNRNNFITVSNYCAERIKKYFNICDSGVHVVHNGVDSSVFTPNLNINDATKFVIPEIECPKILFFSRLVGIKGIDILLKSIESINAQTNVHFFIAGSGHYGGLNSLKFDNVTNFGYVPHEMAPSLMHQSDIFLLLSYHENCPLTLLEAMASGKAIIATSVGGVSEIITNGENGLLIANDGEELVSAIIRLVNDSSLRRKLGLAARKTVEESFTWRKSAMKTEEIYRTIL